MSKSKVNIGSVVAISLVGILLGILILAIPVSTLIRFLFVAFGVITIIVNIPTFFVSISNIGKKNGVWYFLLNAVPIVLGFMLIFWQNWILMVLIGIYLIIFPIVRIMSASKNSRLVKAELMKIIVGVLMIVLGPGNMVNMLFSIAGWALIAVSLVYLLFGIVKSR